MYVCVYLTFTHPFLAFFFSALCPRIVPLELFLLEIRVGRFKGWDIFRSFPCHSSSFFSGKKKKKYSFLSSPSIFLNHFQNPFLNGRSLYRMNQTHCGKSIFQIILQCIFNKPQLPGFAKTSTQSLKV